MHVDQGIDVLRCDAEELLAAIAHAVQLPIALSPDRLAITKLMGLPQHLFTTSFDVARIWTVPRHQVCQAACAMFASALHIAQLSALRCHSSQTILAAACWG